jgi:hypothetical protein
MSSPRVIVKPSDRVPLERAPHEPEERSSDLRTFFAVVCDQRSPEYLDAEPASSGAWVWVPSYLPLRMSRMGCNYSRIDN